MQNTKSFILYKLSLGPQAISLLNTLHTELNMFRINSSHNKSLSLATNSKEVIDGIFR